MSRLVPQSSAAHALARNGGSRKPAEALATAKIQVLLAEKRTNLASLRTGVSLTLFPLSVWTALIATSGYWNTLQVLPFLLPLLAFMVAFLALGVHIVVRSLKRIAHVNALVTTLSREEGLLHEDVSERVAFRDLLRT
jgi:fatty acid desaturase